MWRAQKIGHQFFNMFRKKKIFYHHEFYPIIAPLKTWWIL